MLKKVATGVLEIGAKTRRASSRAINLGRKMISKKEFINLPLVLAFILNFACTINSQWVQTNCPYSGSVNSFTVFGTNIFAGADYSVFLSTDNGSNWTAVSNGLTGAYVHSLVVSDTNLFAGL